MYQLANICPLADLQTYINQVTRLPLLSAEQEHELAVRLSKEQDLEAARALIMSNLRFVVMIARGYQGYGLPQADLVQEGNIGLMKAVKRFDPKMGVRLMSFAVYWIKAEIHEYVFRNWRIIKSVTTKAQKKLFFNLRKFKRDLHWFNADEVEEVADALQVTPAQVREMEMRLSSQDMSLLLSDEDEETRYLGVSESSLPAADASPELQLIHRDQHQQGQEKLYQKLAQLDDRSRDIIESRWLSENKATLHQLAEKYGISYERVRQLEGQAMAKLRAHILA
ncbi:RNA polymerase sigma factor RpoH [Motilimonas cestriensis]|uniref:RNA polymerase sigma factor n=1 Tax=Motilimonas cestriensis TaxID=2742685 RepID=A0ABS8W6W2_9GAMM|nr:RNA polymerase sigma factor RpoH [Motilimonas cestriensis]MCE2593948.1 RNA polymerase sigma factor RpoH [Motilimonas cestriensis]